MDKAIEVIYVKIKHRASKLWLEVTLGKKTGFYGRVLNRESRLFGKIVAFESSDIIKYCTTSLSGLGSPYIPTSETCTILDTIVPESMNYETHIAIRKIKQAIGGNLTDYVCQKLNYNHIELCKALAAEQVDAVAMAIYNIEERGQGMIIGDQTGIGKGRTAAAMIRYGHVQGHKPIFMSEKSTLFSDIYRDMVDIGSGDLNPFIVNAQGSESNVKDKEGTIIYKAPIGSDQARIISSGVIPAKYDYVLCTYSQFSAKEFTDKKGFLQSIARGNILIMDEAHNASGSSNTGEYLKGVVADCQGVLFLSGTFAKRPNNMPIYAMKTSMKDANMDSDQLVEAIKQGGVALQEVLASQLVMEGQMLRRERSFDGVEVNFLTLDELAEEHRAICDNITEIIRDMIVFQRDFIAPEIEKMNKASVADGTRVTERNGTNMAGVKNSPYFSKVFNVFNQMLFAVKADAVADRTIMRLREGKSVVVAFASTMGSFLADMKAEDGQGVSNGDVINADFKTVLQKGLDGLLRYTESDHAGKKTYSQLDIAEFSADAQAFYWEIVDKVKSASTGISISPIDNMIQKIEAAGFSVSEITGRQLAVQFDQGKMYKVTAKIEAKRVKDEAENLGKPGASTVGMVINRPKENVTDAVRKFNNNQTDVLLINQSGSTGISAHAVITDDVKLEQVKQRCMVILQPELNISTEVQKRGRINRTGQQMPPIYDYISSAIPAEKRLVMMLQMKLKSLDANTTSNQNQSEAVLNVDDFLNKYGDKIVHGYLLNNLEINEMLNDPLGLKKDNEDGSKIPEDLAYKTSGRVAILSCEQQEQFYATIIEEYRDHVKYLISMDEFNLVVQTMNLEAETIEAKTCIAGTGGKSAFGNDSIMEKCMCNVLRKPYSLTELQNLLKESLGDKSPQQAKDELVTRHRRFTEEKKAKDVAALHNKFADAINNIHDERGYKKLTDQGERAQYLKERTESLIAARDAAIEDEKEHSDNRYRTMHGNFDYFTIGASYNYPFVVYGGTDPVTVPAIFVGFQIDYKKANPYAPSSVKLRFALSDSHKNIVLASSGEQGQQIRAVIGSSVNGGRMDYLPRWEQLTTKSAVSRKVRYIVTGNLLQASAMYKGSLISYSTLDGSVKKGMLMPDNWTPESKRGGAEVILPIDRALPIIEGLYFGDSLQTMNGIVFHRGRYGSSRYEVSVPKTQKYQHIFQDKDLIALCTNTHDGFEMRSGKMVANFESSNMRELVSILQKKFSVSIKCNPDQLGISLDVDHQKAGQKTPETASAEAQYEKDKQIFERRQFDAQQARERVRGGISYEENEQAAAVKAKAKAKAKAKFLFLASKF